jgi:phosphatidylglycerophosphate synthase
MNMASASTGPLTAEGVSLPPVPRTVFSYDAIFKLPREARYFNVSVLWVAYYPHVTRLLYALRIRHEIVTLASLVCGLAAAVILMYAHTTAALILCAILIHLKDVFDACDGSLARLTDTGHRIGRFLDTIGDGVVFTVLIVAVAWRAVDSGSPVAGTLTWAAAAWLSLFVQCSYFNFYHLQYARVVGANSLSRTDEWSAEEAGDEIQSRAGRRLLAILQAVYRLWFGWQDRLIHRIDRLSLYAARKDNADVGRNDGLWYRARGFLVANSALCYGTHAFVLIVCLLAGHPVWFFPAVAIGMNLYFAAILMSRLTVFRGAL